MDSAAAGLEAAGKLFEDGHYSPALEKYLEVVVGRLPGIRAAAGGLRSLDFLALERVGDLSQMFGNARAAEDIFRALMSVSGHVGNPYAHDYMAAKVSHSRLMQCRTPEAWSSLEALRGIDPVDSIEYTEPGFERWERSARWTGNGESARLFLVSRIYLCLGLLGATEGRYPEACAAFRRGLALGGERREGRPVGPLRLGLASALLERGEFAEAEEQLRLLSQGETADGMPGRSCRATELSAKIQALRGDYGRALAHLRDAADGYLRMDMLEATIPLRMNEAHLLLMLNQTDAAGDILKAVAKVLEPEPRHPARPRLEFLLQLLGIRSGSIFHRNAMAPSVRVMWRTTDAEEIPADPPVEFPMIPIGSSFLAYFEDRSLAHRALLAARGLQAATDSLERLETDFGPVDSGIVQARMRFLRAEDAYYRGDFRAARSLAEKAEADFRIRGMRPDRYQCLRMLGWCDARLGRPEERALHAHRANDLVMEMAGSLASGEKDIYLLNKWSAEEERIGGLSQRLESLDAEARGSSWRVRLRLRWKAWLALLDLAEAVEGRRPEGDAGAPAVSKGKGAARRLAERLLGESPFEWTLRFLALPDRLVVIRSGFLKFDFRVIRIGRAELRQAVQAVHDITWKMSRLDLGNPLWPIQEGRVEAAIAGVARAIELDSLLAGRSRRIRGIRLVPDDVLNGLPFAALKSGGRFLLEDVALEIGVPLGGGAARKRRVGLPEGRALLAGISKRQGKWRPLGSVPEELRTLRLRLERGRCEVLQLLDEEATHRKVSEVLPDMALAHFSCHGDFAPDDLDRTGLVFWGGVDGEVFNLRDIAGLRLDGLELAVLSSCWSADNFVLPGRRLLSLPKSLLQAGTGTVVASLWAGEEKALVGILERFYSLLPGRKVREALRLAQLAFYRDRVRTEDGGGPGQGADWDRRCAFFWSGIAAYTRD